MYISIRGSGEDKDGYDRYKNDIKDSVIWDRLKMQLGLKAYRKLLRRKVVLLPMDLRKADLGLSTQQREDLYANLNVIINSAGTVEFDTRLDLATSVNVTGAVALMQLADQCA